MAMAEALQHAAPSPPAASAAPLAGSKPAGVPLCFLVDDDPSVRHFLSLALHGSGIDTIEFADGAALRAALADSGKPDVIFHDISLESRDAIDSVIALGRLGFRGAVQLMSNRGAAVLDHVKTIGGQNKLNMLPVLKKPFGTEAIGKIIGDLKFGGASPATAQVTLAAALANKWIEFWYQPKIDLRRKQLAGVEVLARARHPQHGIALPAAILTGASDADLLKLAELALLDALDVGDKFAQVGLNLRIAVNMPVAALAKLPVPDLVKAHRKTSDKWGGLIIDLNQDQIIGDLALAAELAKAFEASNVKLAVENVGHAHAALTNVKELPFAELKLDRSFVTDCASNKINAPLCKTVIDLAHGFGSTVVAVGIEKASDAVALVSMGCDYGQGFLLGQPMPEERLLSLLRQRTGRKAAK
jgi:EAL domain-containing protein (putative c-di-GMP-specific phosphodiesterase class I)